MIDNVLFSVTRPFENKNKKRKRRRKKSLPISKSYSRPKNQQQLWSGDESIDHHCD